MTIASGTKINLPDINSSDFGFKPDQQNNQILYGLKAISNVGDELIQKIIDGRPYVSIKDFYQRIKPNKQAMVALIKGGAFDSLEDRKFAMAWYLWETCDKKQRITLQNMSGLIKYNLLPEVNEQQIAARRVFEFNRYLKAICKFTPEWYKLDSRAIEFLNEKDDTKNLINLKENHYLLNVKTWDRYYQEWMNIFREWIAANQQEILFNLNSLIFKDAWEKYALGNYSSWEMESLCFYYHEHELAHINAEKYGIIDYQKLPKEPVIERSFKKGGKEIHMFYLHNICGTCIAKNKTKSTVSLLTPSGVVEVKFRKEYFALFDRRISQRGSDGKKHIIENSWFDRGGMIMVMGIRSEDNFIAKKYNSTPGHTLYQIDKVYPNGDLELRSERKKGELEDEE